MCTIPQSSPYIDSWYMLVCLPLPVMAGAFLALLFRHMAFNLYLPEVGKNQEQGVVKNSQDSSGTFYKIQINIIQKETTKMHHELMEKYTPEVV